MTVERAKPSLPTELLIPQEVADIFRVEVDTLAKWRWKGIGPDFIKIGRMVRYRRECVEAILTGEQLLAQTEADAPKVEAGSV